MKIKLKRVIPLQDVSARFYDPERDGVTQTLLTTFKGCRERARLVLSGWTSKRSSLGLVFGGLTHGIQQRLYEDVRDGRLDRMPSLDYIVKVCKEVEQIWREENPRADEETLGYLEYSMILLEALMPQYFLYWKIDFQKLWTRVESEFKVPIEVHHPTDPKKTLKTFVRGKMDGAYREKSKARPWLFETKTKAYLGEKGEGDLADILPHDLQSNVYLLHLWYLEKVLPKGLLYNIIRRPALRQKKNESLVKFARRVAADIYKRPDYYFVRIRMDVEKKDLERNELEIHDLVSDFLMWWNGLAGHYKNSDACQNKYGTCAFLPVCSRGDYSSFYKRDKVFRELADEL